MLFLARKSPRLKARFRQTCTALFDEFILQATWRSCVQRFWQNFLGCSKLHHSLYWPNLSYSLYHLNCNLLQRNNVILILSLIYSHHLSDIASVSEHSARIFSFRLTARSHAIQISSSRFHVETSIVSELHKIIFLPLRYTFKQRYGAKYSIDNSRHCLIPCGITMPIR